MIIKTLSDYENIPAGSVIYVDTETEEWYTGLWSYNCCTVHVAVPKSICEIIEE